MTNNGKQRNVRIIYPFHYTSTFQQLSTIVKRKQLVSNYTQRNMENNFRFALNKPNYQILKFVYPNILASITK